MFKKVLLKSLISAFQLYAKKKSFSKIKIVLDLIKYYLIRITEDLAHVLIFIVKFGKFSK